MSIKPWRAYKICKSFKEKLVGLSPFQEGWEGDYQTFSPNLKISSLDWKMHGKPKPPKMVLGHRKIKPILGIILHTYFGRALLFRSLSSTWQGKKLDKLFTKNLSFNSYPKLFLSKVHLPGMEWRRFMCLIPLHQRFVGDLDYDDQRYRVSCLKPS